MRCGLLRGPGLGCTGAAVEAQGPASGETGREGVGDGGGGPVLRPGSLCGLTARSRPRGVGLYPRISQTGYGFVRCTDVLSTSVDSCAGLCHEGLGMW